MLWSKRWKPSFHQVELREPNNLSCHIYTNVQPLKSLAEWHDFRVCFHHSGGSKDHESLLAPSMSALKYHKLRSGFVLKVIFTHCTPLHELNCIDYGWNIVSNTVEIVWDDAENIEKVIRQVRLVVARGPSVMEQLQVVEAVLNCANHVP